MSEYMLDRMAAFMLDRLPEYMIIARTIVRINMSKRMPDLKICQIACKIEFQKFNLEDMSDRRPDWMSECNVGRIPDRFQIESWCQIECQYLRKKSWWGSLKLFCFKGMNWIMQSWYLRLNHGASVREAALLHEEKHPNGRKRSDPNCVKHLAFLAAMTSWFWLEKFSFDRAESQFHDPKQVSAGERKESSITLPAFLHVCSSLVINHWSS